MDFAKRELLNSIVVYAEMMNNVNIKFKELIEDNINKQFQENEQLFYEIISEIMRLLPVKKTIDGKRIEGPDPKSGIMLLQTEIPFLYDDYQRILNNEIYNQIMMNMSLIRNKFIHEPHNISAAFYVGGKTSCSMGLYYKERLCPVSTIEMTNIIIELNGVFDKLKNFFVKTVEGCEEKYKEYPCYKAMMSYDFKKYNEDYPMIPDWILNDRNEKAELLF